MSLLHRLVHRVSVRFVMLYIVGLSLVVPTGIPAATAHADGSYQTLPFTQDWSNNGLITNDDNWNGVPGIIGYRGDGLTTAEDINPQTVLADGTNTPVHVLANRTSTSLIAGGVAEFELTNSVVALQGSGTADAPFLLIHLNTTGRQGILVSYNLRDIDGSTDNATQAVALQYRVGASGNFTNIPAGFVADATSGPSQATQVTPVGVVLPAAANNQSQVQVRIITTNANGNDEWVGVDDISITDGALSASCPTSLTTTVGTATSGTVSATDTDGTVTGASITSATVTGITLDGVTPGSTLNATLNVADTTPPGNYNVVITFTSSNSPSSTCAIPVTVNAPGGECPAPPGSAPLTPIATIQGSGAASALDGSNVTIRGMVVGDFQANDQLDGFFVQDAGDGNPATSDGIFIFAPGAPNVTAGSAVQVTGEVEEFNQLTELKTVSALITCGPALTIAPTNVNLPVTAVSQLERYEGMLVRFPQELAVTEHFNLGRFGEVAVAANGRIFNPTNSIDPNEPDNSAVAAAANLNSRRRVIVDDGSTRQNPDPVPYLVEGTLRIGDTATNLTGVLSYGFGAYRLQPTVAPAFARTNPRLVAPEPVRGNVKVASFNVLNYFTTLDQPGAQCFPSNSRDDCRGANSPEEFERQRAKIVAALKAIDADVVGLIEVENNGATAIGNLVEALNAASGAGTYAVIADPATGVGGDAIKIALIYKPARVTPVGASLSSDDPIFERRPVAQTFSLNANGEKFTMVVNHFKSKGSCPSDSADPNADKGDGQGCWNLKRTQQAQALLTFIETLKASSGDSDVLAIGDLNAYGEEDPIDTLVGDGLVNQLTRFIEKPYSFVFDGESGYLDHALATTSLSAQVAGATEWHINADEPRILDYNTEFNPPSLYAPTPFRSSDHDPVIVGLNLGAATAPGNGPVYLPLVRR